MLGSNLKDAVFLAAKRFLISILQPSLKQSMSSILISSKIFSIRIEESLAGEWQASPGPWKKARTLELRLSLGEILKGRLRQTTGFSFEQVVKQQGRSLITDLTGIWNAVPIEAGTKLVAFSDAPDDDVTTLVQD